MAKTRADISQNSSTLLQGCDTGNIEFKFRLPEEGLSLRGASIAEGLPELRFDPSPRVPTITEGDVATVARLVSEGKRPGFFYTGFPLTHPLHHSRLFTLYSPQWLRWTGIGKDMAEADWKMKCVHVGTKTNADKSRFESISRSSELEGLGTRWDFPEDGEGPTIMSCDHAIVQKNANEIKFPKEPKIKITDGCSSLYSKYITEVYQSVAYYDEPKFLKMQEILKLILVMEWLYNEKGVRMNENWMKKHTAKPTDAAKINLQREMQSRKAPSHKIIPKLYVHERPPSDITVRTFEAELYRYLRTDLGIERRYGYYDFGNAETIMFKEDGTPCPPQKCLKMALEHQSPLAHFKMWLYLPIPRELQIPESLAKGRDALLEILPGESIEEISQPLPISVATSIEDSTDCNSMNVKVTEKFRPHPPLALPPLELTTTMTATVDNYELLFATEDPNEPIRPEIPGVCEAIYPDVESWNELISEMSVPIPRVWQEPFKGIGEPSAFGGVTTSNFREKEEPLRSRVADRKSEWKDNYQRKGLTLAVRSDFVTAQGTIKLVDNPFEFSTVSEKFRKTWIKGPCPNIRCIYSICNPFLQHRFEEYRKTLSNQLSEEHFHGTSLSCDITSRIPPSLCKQTDCGICGIASAGMNPNAIRSDKKDFQRFGKGFYLAPNSSKCNDYTVDNSSGHKGMLLCDVLPGCKYTRKVDDRHLQSPPSGFHSVLGKEGGRLNYPEIVLYKEDAIMPRYFIIY